MKLNKLFHWLYFSVMMLPIFILPIFALAVRSDNNFEPISIQIGEIETQTLHFNQYIYNPVPSGELEENKSVALWGEETLLDYDGDYYFNLEYADSSADFIIKTGGNGECPVNENDIVYIRFSCRSSRYVKFNLLVEDSDTILNIDLESFSSRTTKEYSFRYHNEDYETQYIPYLEFLYTAPVDDFDFIISDIQIFNLTLIYGSGNEPNIFNFNNQFPNTYDFTLDTPIDIVLGEDVVTYNDTDFASQMVYTLYQGVNKYFNYDSVFNFGDLYNWCVTTFFNGQISLGFFIMWHLLIYWLLTSLLWLLFDVLIYVPMLIHRWLDKASLD